MTMESHHRGHGLSVFVSLSKSYSLAQSFAHSLSLSHKHLQSVCLLHSLWFSVTHSNDHTFSLTLPHTTFSLSRTLSVCLYDMIFLFFILACKHTDWHTVNTHPHTYWHTHTHIHAHTHINHTHTKPFSVRSSLVCIQLCCVGLLGIRSALFGHWDNGCSAGKMG